MKNYHKVWLMTHPERSQKWLGERLLEGFDIHHIDGNHNNDDPDNLVLIESADHMRLHGMQAIRRFGPKPIDREFGKMAYEARALGERWDAVAIRLADDPCASQAAIRAAKRHAQESGLEWPIPVNIPYRVGRLREARAAEGARWRQRTQSNAQT